MSADHAQHSTPNAQRSSLHISIIDGSEGYRLGLCTLILRQWPDARIESIDPFSQTMVDAGTSFGGKSDAILLGGIGTLNEALLSLKKMTSRTNSPPVILLISHDLTTHQAEIISAGATAVLFKDALSRNTLISTLNGIVEKKSPPLSMQFGQFSFIHGGIPVLTHIDGFQPIRVLSNNEFSVVFHAERITDRQPVVIKILVSNPVTTSDSVQQAGDRYQFFSTLTSSYIAQYFDVGITSAWPYVAIEYFPAGDLRSRLDAAGGVPVTRAFNILRQLAEALNLLHVGRYAHLDIKPENMFFRNEQSLVLIDFNISTTFGSTAQHNKNGDALGSPYYMSPEQGQGFAIDGRSDLYSAGVVFFEMLAGEKPYMAESSAQIIYKHLHEEIPLLPKRVREYQPIVDGLMAKNPDERFQSCAELLAALVDCGN